VNLVLDIGNSRVKAGVFNGRELIHVSAFATSQTNELKKILQSFPNIRFAIVSSVLIHAKELINILTNKINCVEFNFNTKIPIKNNYLSPETLGNDRLAAAVGAAFRFPTKNCLIIDAGTCIKYDFLNAEGEFIGGAISPGLEMRFKALNNFTDRLPLLVPNPDFDELTGKTTAESILCGVQLGVLQEMKGMISLYKEKYSDLQCVITGGDWQFFENDLKNSIFAAPFLLLEGLNEILHCNVYQKI
jgi:type III pantothenate kinase